MSCVADAKAARMNSIRVSVKVLIRTVAAIRPIATSMHTCMVRIHQRLLRNMSTMGLQRGFITQGMLIRLVRRARVPLSMPISLNITRDMVLTMKYGMPSTK